MATPCLFLHEDDGDKTQQEESYQSNTYAFLNATIGVTFCELISILESGLEYGETGLFVLGDDYIADND